MTGEKRKGCSRTEGLEPCKDRTGTISVTGRKKLSYRKHEHSDGFSSTLVPSPPLTDLPNIGPDPTSKKGSQSPNRGDKDRKLRSSPQKPALV